MAPGRIRVYRDDYFDLQRDAAGRAFVLRRFPRRFESLETLEHCFNNLRLELGEESQRIPRLFIDAREGPGNNDDHFEQRFAELRQQLLTNFRQVAVLMASQIGMLHATRLIGEDRMTYVRAFLNENEAWQWLERAIAD